MNKETGQKNEVGAGWQNEDGSITIVLDYKIVLSQRKGDVYTLFPAFPVEEKQTKVKDDKTKTTQK